MGFGHRVYKTGDVRAQVLKDYAHKAAALAGQTKWEESAAIIEDVLAKEKNLFPNLDWPAGRLYHALGLEVPLYTPFFVAGASPAGAPMSSSSWSTTASCVLGAAIPGPTNVL